MRRYEVLLELRALADLESYYDRAVASGAGTAAAHWFNRIERAILALEFEPKWRSPIREQALFREPLFEIVFERRFRIIHTVHGDRVHVLCIRGEGLTDLRGEDLPASEDSR